MIFWHLEISNTPHDVRQNLLREEEQDTPFLGRAEKYQRSRGGSISGPAGSIPCEKGLTGSCAKDHARPFDALWRVGGGKSSGKGGWALVTITQTGESPLDVPSPIKGWDRSGAPT